MTAMPHNGAMQFFGKDFATSYGFAQRFAGEEGHVATLPEIITARAVSPFEHQLWNTYYTTSSSEYFGTTRGGNDIVIVAHGNGPASNLTGIEAMYHPYETERDGRPVNSFGHVTHDQFLALERGDYGDVSIIDFSALKTVYSERWFEFIDLEQASLDPLLQARLGNDWPKVLLQLHTASRHERLCTPGSMPKTIKSDGPFPYWVKKRRDDMPYGHLLAVSRDKHMHSGSDQFICIDVSVHERGNGKRFIGVRPGGNVAETHPGPGIIEYNGAALMQPHVPDESVSPVSFYRIMQRDNQWFTSTRKEGYDMDSGWPEFRVTEVEPIGTPGQITAPDEMFFFRYDMADVMWQAPEGANAYYCGEVYNTKVNGKNTSAIDVYFCKATVDTTQRCVSQASLEGNFDLQMQLLERYEASTHNP